MFGEIGRIERACVCVAFGIFLDSFSSHVYAWR
jgi:hypothetical protein